MSVSTTQCTNCVAWHAPFALDLTTLTLVALLALSRRTSATPRAYCPKSTTRALRPKLPHQNMRKRTSVVVNVIRFSARVINNAASRGLGNPSVFQYCVCLPLFLVPFELLCFACLSSCSPSAASMSTTPLPTHFLGKARALPRAPAAKIGQCNLATARASTNVIVASAIELLDAGQSS